VGLALARGVPAAPRRPHAHSPRTHFPDTATPAQRPVFLRWGERERHLRTWGLPGGAWNKVVQYQEPASALCLHVAAPLRSFM